jgi:hypothetical protein
MMGDGTLTGIYKEIKMPPMNDEGDVNDFSTEKSLL